MNTKKAQSTPTRSRGRPRTFDREAALVKAKRAFHARGYDRVSVADLAADIGINPPSFYAAFGSKAQLFGEVAQHYAQDQGSFGNTISAQAQSVNEWVTGLLNRAIEAYTADDECRGCLISAHLGGGSAAEAKHACKPFQQATLEALAATAERLGHARPPVLANTVSVLMAGLSAMARGGASADDLRDALALVRIDGA